MDISSINWTARWIWYEPASKENSYMAARKSFVVDSAPAECLVTLSADTCYKFYVNGKLVCRGPVRGGGRYRYYDQVDIAPYLVLGKNVLAVLVHHYGFVNSRFLKSRAGFILQGQVSKGISLDTGSSGWKVIEGSAWFRPVVRSSIALAFPEVLDMRKMPEDWTEIGFDDSGWNTPYQIGGPPCEPWTHMLPRDIPFLAEYFGEIQPEFLSARKAETYPEVRTIDFGLTYSDDLNRACAYLFVFLRSRKDTRFDLPFAVEGKVAFFLDGKPVAERPPSADDPRSKWINPISLDIPQGTHQLLIKVFKESFMWAFSYAVPQIPELEFSGDGTHYTDHCDQWQVVGPFDGPGVHPPEAGIDLSASYPGMTGPVHWQATRSRLNVSRQVTCELPTTELSLPRQFPIAILAQPSGTCTTFTIDLGREITGFPYVEVESEEDGAVIDLAYSEFLQNNRVVSTQWVYDFADRVILKKGRQVYESSFWWKGFRYLQITARNVAGAIKISGVKVRQHHYPAKEVGSFECSDPLLNRIWQTGVYTLLCCMNDVYMDCPSREQSLYLGDLLVEQLVSFYTSGDRKLAKSAYHQFSRYQYSTGFFSAVSPGQTEKMDDIFVDQCLAFVGNLWNFYLFTGEAGVLDMFFPTIEKLIDGILKYKNADGLYQGITDRVFVDHVVFQPAHQDKTRINTGLNLVVYYTLLDAVRIAGAMGKFQDAARYTDLAEKLKEGIRQKLWCPKKGVFIEGMSEGKPMETVSVHSNVLAILYDVAPEEARESILNYIFDETKPVIRNYSPFFAYFVHRMFFKLNRPGKVLELVRKQWGEFYGQGFTTWPETFTGLYDSNCHAYSCTPNIDLSADILGIKPLQPGFVRFTVHPQLQELEWASGTVPTPAGAVAFSWKKDRGSYSLVLRVPPNTTGELTLPGGAGVQEWLKDGQPQPTGLLNHVLECPSGEHHITIETVEASSYIV
jgi:alpha-L-rhamnosidase